MNHQDVTSIFPFSPNFPRDSLGIPPPGFGPPGWWLAMLTLKVGSKAFVNTRSSLVGFPMRIPMGSQGWVVWGGVTSYGFLGIPRGLVGFLWILRDGVYPKRIPKQNQQKAPNDWYSDFFRNSWWKEVWKGSLMMGRMEVNINILEVCGVGWF